MDFEFALSQGLFSSADIDTGTRLLLKALSQKLDEALREERPLPAIVLDAGSGVGVLGICAARALAGTPGLRVRAQDRDELARAFTEHNAARNGIDAAVLGAHTGPLLDGPAPWDLILSNVPAKTGEPVLLDFVSRSAGLLSEGGSVMVVVVNTLAGLFRDRIQRLALPLLHDETGKEHTVLAYGPKTGQNLAPHSAPTTTHDDDFLAAWPAYFRGAGDHEMENTGYHIDAIHGAAGFDRSGASVAAMARLVVQLGAPLAGGCASKPVLVHEPDQGHFPVWLLKHLEKTAPGSAPGRLVLSGRNILALEAARHNLRNEAAAVPAVVTAVDPLLGKDALLAAAGELYGAAFLFPDLPPRTSRIGACWEGLDSLLAEGGIVLAALPSSEAERFDRAKTRGFARLGSHKRHGFRALGYKKLP
jgi:hypothetical protein